MADRLPSTAFPHTGVAVIDARIKRLRAELRRLSNDAAWSKLPGVADADRDNAVLKFTDAWAELEKILADALAEAEAASGTSRRSV
jgi:hypothetical protein